MKLSDIMIRKTKAESKAYKLSDGGGMYLEVMPNGSKYWRLKYRFVGKEKKLALGVYPDVSLALARERRQDARNLLATGTDPSENKKAVKAAKFDKSVNSFEVVAREWLSSHMANKAASHREKVARCFELYISPWLGSKPIADISAPQILETLKRIEKLGILETAHRTLRTCGQVFRYAAQTGKAVRDVTADLKGALSPSRTVHMA
jgi:hypothetical protein